MILRWPGSRSSQDQKAPSSRPPPSRKTAKALEKLKSAMERQGSDMGKRERKLQAETDELEKQLSGGTLSESDEGHVAKAWYDAGQVLYSLHTPKDEEWKGSLEEKAGRIEGMFFSGKIRTAKAHEALAQILLESYSLQRIYILNGVARAERILLEGKTTFAESQERLAAIILTAKRTISIAEVVYALSTKAAAIIRKGVLVSPAAEEHLAECVVDGNEAFEMLKERKTKSERSEAIMAQRVCEYVDMERLAVGHVYALLSEVGLGERAELRLAMTLFKKSTGEEAAYSSDLLISGAVARAEAQEWLAKTVVNHLDADTAFSILMAGNIASVDAWDILGNKILEEGTARQKRLVEKSLGEKSLANRTTVIIGSGDSNFP